MATFSSSIGKLLNTIFDGFNTVLRYDWSTAGVMILSVTNNVIMNSGFNPQIQLKTSSKRPLSIAKKSGVRFGSTITWTMLPFCQMDS